MSIGPVHRRLRATRQVLEEVPGASWILGTIALVFAVILPPQLTDYHDLAVHVRDDGAPVVVDDVEVRVDRYLNRFRMRVELDGVRVALDGRAEPVVLRLVAGRDLPGETPGGWQAPTVWTGYEPPLEVWVVEAADGSVETAVALPDLEYYESHDDSVRSRWAGLAALLLAVGWDAARRRQRALGGRRESAVAEGVDGEEDQPAAERG